MALTAAPAAPRRKVIIDTDPGVDDSFAILLALRSPEIEVIGLTSLFGNVRTPTATRNALHLLERFGRSDIPVYEGHLTSITGDAKERIADFVHGDDGFGNTGEPSVSTEPVAGTSAAEFIVQSANAFPGQVTVVALASATNVALALRLDRVAVTRNLRSVVHLGGAFFTNGNVNPAAEANIFGDPDAADELYGSGADVTVVGLDVTQRLRLSESDLAAMRDAAVIDESSAPENPADHPHCSKHGAFLHAISEFYMAFHVRTTGFRGIFMHDPAAVVLAFAPKLFSTKRGRVRVATEGLCKGQTVLDTGDKLWSFPNAWGEGERPAIAVALDVDVEMVMALFRERFGIER
jgi:uridine nucleosidase